MTTATVRVLFVEVHLEDGRGCRGACGDTCVAMRSSSTRNCASFTTPMPSTCLLSLGEHGEGPRGSRAARVERVHPKKDGSRLVEWSPAHCTNGLQLRGDFVLPPRDQTPLQVGDHLLLAAGR